MKISGTHFNYFQICLRKLWLFSNGINLEHTSDLVLEGKLIHEDSYPQRSSKYEEVELDGIKIDFYDSKNKVIHEIKKSNKMEAAHEWQLKYYIYVFMQNGIDGVSGRLEYPLLRKTKDVYMSQVDIDIIYEMKLEIERIALDDSCPPLKKQGVCKNCSYFEFCYSTEEEEL